ncbi:MAG: polymerase, sigma-24 subunit, subfamily [Ilumatobacteraceae bacterium]|nr:polymerase, sigma-24 subunit, subfamily [Ilumatobacteraceae bacterium]
MIDDPLPGRAAAGVGFDAFYSTRLARALRLAHLVTGSVAVGQEVAQDAFVAVHTRWATIDNPDAYLRTAVVNLSRSVQRRQIRERRHASTIVEPVQTLPQYDETWQRVVRLPVDQRAVVVLRYYEDMSLNEIAAELNRPLGTVKSTLHRALAHLKETLHERP